MQGSSQFVAYIDAIGKLDGQRFLIDWKTTASRYPEEPEGLLSLDPQLICYSWISGIPDVALVVFVRKRFPEIQYLKAPITDGQREEFWPAGLGNGKPDRSGPVPAAQRHSLAEGMKKTG